MTDEEIIKFAKMFEKVMTLNPAKNALAINLLKRICSNDLELKRQGIDMFNTFILYEPGVLTDFDENVNP